MIDDVKQAMETLRKGGIILYPTDTIWGLGCDATNPDAVQRIYELKRRSEEKSMLVLLDSPAKLQAYVDEVPQIAWDLIELSTQPLTIIYSGAKCLANNLIGVDKTIGIRITRESFSRKLCEAFRKPIVSTSANLSGEPAPVLFSDISKEIKDGVDFTVSYRQDDITAAQPSSIIKLEKNNLFKIIRL